MSAFTPVLTAERLATAYTYAGYRQLIDNLLAEGRATGPKQSEALTHYSQLNVKRMQRLDKTVQLQPALRAAAASLSENYIWLIITEGWCGDAAQLVPVFEAVAQVSAGRISTRYLLRDDNLDLMDHYLTKGGRAIPRLIMLGSDKLHEVAQWGPRPEPAQTQFWEMKDQQLSYDEVTTALHTWYAHDHTLTTQAELLALLVEVMA